MSKLQRQIILFGFVGGICFLIDYGIMVALTELCGVDYLISSGIAFTVAVIVNYLLSMRLVFASDPEKNKIIECGSFVILSVIGLALNQILMAFFVELCGVFYMLAKIVVTGIVMIYNFVTRKFLLETRRGV